MCLPRAPDKHSQRHSFEIRRKILYANLDFKPPIRQSLRTDMQSATDIRVSDASGQRLRRQDKSLEIQTTILLKLQVCCQGCIITTYHQLKLIHHTHVAVYRKYHPANSTCLHVLASRQSHFTCIPSRSSSHSGPMAFALYQLAFEDPGAYRESKHLHRQTPQEIWLVTRVSCTSTALIGD